MKLRPFQLIAVTVFTLACSDSSDLTTTPTPTEDTAADGADGSVGDTQADSGEADVVIDASSDGADASDGPDGEAADTTPPVDVPSHPTTGPRAYALTAADTDVIGSGRMADARPGDIVLRNDVVRVVIRSGDAGLYLAGLGGGAIIDALPESASPGFDELQEHLPLLQFHSFAPGGKLQITNAGDEATAEVTWTGAPNVPAIINGYLDGLQIDDVEMVVTYRLAAGSRVVSVTQSLSGQETAQAALLQFPGGFMETVNDDVNGWVAQHGPKVAYGLLAGAPFSVAKFGGLSLLFGPNVTPLTPGGPPSWTHWLVIGEGGLSTVLDEMYALRSMPTGAVEGTVDDPTGVEIVARDATAAQVSRFRPDAEGAFAGTLPVGLYTLTAEGPGRLPGAPVSADVTVGGTLKELSLTASAPAFLKVTVPEATRITIDGKEFPVPSGETSLPVAPGAHIFWASRGFEYEIEKLEITLAVGEEKAWAPVVKRVVDTAGWIGADFHLHSEWSTDSNVPLATRILSCAAEGVEYAVSTDHDVVTDYGVELPKSLEGTLLLGIGCETSTARYGHLNVWPLEADKSKPGRGSPLWHGLEFGALMSMLTPEAPGRIVQINHGRGSGAGQTFDQVGYDNVERDPALLADFRFTAMEVLNDGGGGYDSLIEDWFSFVDEGKPVAATGVSDSHTLGARCGHARTWVEVPTEDLKVLTTEQANQGVLMRRTIASNGPFITLEANGNNTVHVRVAGPSWMPIETIRVYADGALDTTIELSPYAGNPIRYDQDVVLKKLGTRWSAAVAEAAGSVPPIAKHQIRGVSPVAWLIKAP